MNLHSSLSPQKRNVAMFGLALLACTMQSRQLSLDFNITKEHVPNSSVRNLSEEQKTEVTSAQSLLTLEPGALPPALDELAAKFRPFIDRVLARLSEAERKEVNTHLQQDIRQAWITVSYAQKMSDAFVQASYVIYGKHPDHIWPSIVADRKARLGAEYYDWYSSDDLLRPDVPKIHPQPTTNESEVVPMRAERERLLTESGPHFEAPHIPPRKADMHAANGTDATGTAVGSVPLPERKTV